MSGVVAGRGPAGLGLEVQAAGFAPAAPPNSTVWRDRDGRIAARGYTVDGFHWMQVPGVGSFRFSQRREGVKPYPDPGVSSARVLDSYRRSVLPLALQALGWEVLHASAVRMDGRVVGLCAVSETGKSTIAYALSRRGHPLFADDALPYDLSGETPRAMPLPFRLRLRAEPRSFFAASEGGRSETVEGEAAPLGALCVLERALASDRGGPVRVRPLSPAASFRRVLAHAYCFDLNPPERRETMVARYLELVSGVPVLEVRLWPGLRHVERAVDAIERSVERAVA